MARPPMAAPGVRAFALTLILLGVLDAGLRSFEPVWQSVPAQFSIRGLLLDLCAALAILTGLGLLVRRTSAIAARVLAGGLMLWLLTFKLHMLLREPLQPGSYESLGETAVLVAAACSLYAHTATTWDRRWLGMGVGRHSLRVASTLFGLSLLAFGFSHFADLDLTAALVPHWLPWPAFWAGAFGCTYIAAGLAILIEFRAQFATTLVAAQMALFTALVWVPAVIVAPSAGAWSELADSWMLTVAAWVVATALGTARTAGVRGE